MSDADIPVKKPGQPKELSHDPRRLKRRRLAAGMSQVAAARAAGRTKSHLSKLEHGAYGASPELLGTFAALYGCRLADLVPAQYRDLMARFAEEADPDGALPDAERDIRALNLLAEYLRNGEPETNGAAA